MSSYELVELLIDPKDVKITLEDEFTMTAVLKELDELETREEIYLGAKQILKVLMQRQALVRALVKRLTELEDKEKLRRQKIK
tara:strand:+ start:1233 stop:1481 length:249 start_codon:yes stop_codon:yes gene_type:complete